MRSYPLSLHSHVTLWEMRSTVQPPDDGDLVNPSLLGRTDLFLNYQNSFHEAQGSLSFSKVAAYTQTGGYPYPHTAQYPAYLDTTTSTPFGLGYHESDLSSQGPVFDDMHCFIIEYILIGPSSTQISNNRYDVVHASHPSFVAGTSSYQRENLDLNSTEHIYNEEHRVSDGVVSSEV